MVIKGGSRGGAMNLAKHLLRADTNESLAVMELRHVAATDLAGALRDMETVALGTKARRALYHASINVARDEALTPEQWRIAVDRLEAALGLHDHPRALVMHRKAGRAHLHVVWSRIDIERMRAVHDGHNYRIHETVARDLERSFGLRRVQGAHVERTGERPARTPSAAEMQQAARTGIAVTDVKTTVTSLWRGTDSGRTFVAALARAGFTLAMGDKGRLVFLDPSGGVHALARRIDGVKAAEVKERLSEIDIAALPFIAEVRTRFADEGRMSDVPAATIEEDSLPPEPQKEEKPWVTSPSPSTLANLEDQCAVSASVVGEPKQVQASIPLGRLLSTASFVVRWIVGLERERGPPRHRQMQPSIPPPTLGYRDLVEAKPRREPAMVLLGLLKLRGRSINVQTAALQQLERVRGRDVLRWHP